MTHRRVLHLIANLDVGGAQEVVVSLLPQLPTAGWDPLVATLRDGPMRGRLEEAGVKVIELPGRTAPVTAGLPAMRQWRLLHARLLQAIRSERVDIVQTHLLRSNDFVVLGAARQEKQRRVPVVWTVHNARLHLRKDQVPDARLLRLKTEAYRLAYRFGSRFGADFVAVSDEAGRSVLREYRPAKGHVHVIPNGVDMARYAGPVDRAAIRDSLDVEASSTLIVVVAKLYPQKGHVDLLQALERMRPDRSRLQVLLVGEGPLRGELEHEVSSRGLSETVRFLGVRMDIPELLAASDLFVLPSRWEGLPMALLEAMASGVPVVATSVSGTVQVIEHDISGLLVPPGEPGLLAETIEELLSDPARMARLAEAGRRRVEAEYSVVAQARRHARLYDRLAASESPR